MRKSKLVRLNALALASMLGSGALVTAGSAQAFDIDLYGIIDIGLERYSGDGTGLIFPGMNSVAGNTDDKDFTLSNGLQSRIGLRGGEQLTNQVELTYTLEYAVDVLVEDSGMTDSSIGTRLGWVALGGDWGQVKVGTQWMALYEFGAWNTNRNDVHGYGAYYYTTGLLRDSLAFGFRQSSAISYQYGSAWGHSDPFAFNITLGIGEGERDELDPADPDDAGSASNESGVSSVQIAAQYSFNDMLSVNAVYVREIVDVPSGFDDSEARLYNLGARWTINPQVELGFNYANADDDAGDERDAFTLAGFFNFGQGWDASLGIGRGSADLDDVQDLDLNIYGFVRHAFTDRTNARFEFEYAELEDGDDDTLGMIALQHHF
ncbi:MAG: porin [Ectothiorhodospiraceae bacterium]|nr:porin [Ectothiorhodospiraceae bacterium]